MSALCNVKLQELLNIRQQQRSGAELVEDIQKQANDVQPLAPY